MCRWISLSLVPSGFIFCKSNPSHGGTWEFISRAVADELDCEPAELDTEEDDDGREFVTFRGERVAEIHFGYISNKSPAHHRRNAA